jgi:tetratricopeptide (TPR) repeat protein
VIGRWLWIIGFRAYLLAADPSAAASVPPPIEKEVRARATFQAGVAAYDARAFARAIELFQEAYRLVPAPELLFNLAQAYRAAGDCGRARDTYANLLALSPAPARLGVRAADALATLASCEQGAEAPRAENDSVVVPERDASAVSQTRPNVASSSLVATEQAPTVPVQLRLTTSDTPLERSGPSRSYSRACVFFAGTALALVTTGLVTGGLSWREAREAESAQVWDLEAQTSDQRAHTFAGVARGVSIGAGAAALATAVLCWPGRR